MNEQQLQNAAQAAARAGLAGLLVCPSPELRLLTGFSPMMCERFQGLFIPTEGACFYVCNLLYGGEVSDALGDAVPIYTWRDGENMSAVVAGALRKNGMTGGRIGVNSSAQAFNVLDIASDCGVCFVSGVDILDQARMIKTSAELASLRQAAAVADKAFAQVLGFIRPGLSEGDIYRFLAERMSAASGSDCWGIIASGPNSGYPHYLGTDRIIQPKDMMILDFGCAIDGLYSDMSRTVFVGGISEEEREIYELVRCAQEAGEAAAVNGAFIPDVDAAARSIIEGQGYGDAFVTRLGHGIGYMLHEAPYIKKDNRRSLEPGMTFSVEPGIYLTGRVGMRIEDIVAVTGDGNEILNKASKEIIIL